jgi:hypothetical protein
VGDLGADLGGDLDTEPEGEETPGAETEAPEPEAPAGEESSLLAAPGKRDIREYEKSTYRPVNHDKRHKTVPYRKNIGSMTKPEGGTKSSQRS